MSTQKEIDWGGTGGKFTKCSDSHPALTLGEYKIYGGACGHPVHLDCDVYVALQSGSRVLLPMPWDTGFGTIVQVEYPIQDMKAPGNPKNFTKMIDWLCTQLQEGKKVHVGCIGGHGRTGTVLAAIVAKMLPGEEDAIGYVRKNYCDHAVESSEQVAFLVTHFGVKSVTGYKEGGKNLWKKPSSHTPWSTSTPKSGASEFSSKKTVTFANAKRVIDPVPSRRNIYTTVS